MKTAFPEEFAEIEDLLQNIPAAISSAPVARPSATSRSRNDDLYENSRNLTTLELMTCEEQEASATFQNNDNEAKAH